LVRSPGFGSNRSNLPTTTEFYIKNNLNYFSLVAFAKVINLATPINLLTHYAKGTPLYFYFLGK